MAAVTAVSRALWARERSAVEREAARRGGEAARRGMGRTKAEAAKGAATMHIHTRERT
jgi:hypothetical protein